MLEPAGIDENALDRLMGRLLAHQIDYADLYFQYRRHESWSLEESKVKSGSHTIDQGVGVRAVSREKTGFAYSDEIGLPTLLEAAGAARAIAHQGGSTQAPTRWKSGSGLELYPPTDPLTSLSDASKIKLLEDVEAEARREVCLRAT